MPSPQASSTNGWPPFEPSNVLAAVVQALDLACQPVVDHLQCQTVRPSGARFEAVAPNGSFAYDRELTFTASGPIELESEARRLFAAVGDAVTGDQALSREWQDHIWAAFDVPSTPSSALPNGAGWRATRQDVGDVLEWKLSLTW